MLKTNGRQARNEVNAAREFAAALGDRARIAFARAFTSVVIETYWQCLQERYDLGFCPKTQAPELKGIPLSIGAEREAARLGKSFAELEAIEAGYRIGCIYTATLPPKYRSEYGVYYTPPALSNRLIEMCTDVGVNWKTCRVLDGSCGGAAFLAPVALRILKESPGFGKRGPEILSTRLRGFEVDPFAAWMSQVLVEAAALPFFNGVRLPEIVDVCDSLDRVLDEEDRFDLVIGNPPYGRLRLDPFRRARFSRSLYGHANLYGVFTHAALGWVKEQGIIAHVTPTSMLGGEYFKGLRGLLAEEAPPQAIDFVSDREGVFDDVLQETMLAVYKRGARQREASVGFLSLGENGAAASHKAGTFTLPRAGSSAWLIPRTPNHERLVRNLENLDMRLADYGYGVSTGPLVWNRHKPQFHGKRVAGTLPVIWAEAVTSAGTFVWKSEKRNHLPWFKPKEKDQWLIGRRECVLVQRTTAKEQTRRLVVAELPLSFIRQHGGVIVENHLNMVRPAVRTPLISTAVITALLKSSAMDRAFRCINGSVAVSAYELESLPLPPLAEAQELERKIYAGWSAEEIEEEIERLYLGIQNAAASIA
jgi:adenine-specific DNA-methyltransferase